MAKLPDERVVEFLAKSPIKAFGGMADLLGYVDGESIEEGVEYELFNRALGDNPERKVHFRPLEVDEVTGNTLFAFLGHAQDFQLVTRRRFILRGGEEVGIQPEPWVEYQLTSGGKYVKEMLSGMANAGSSPTPE